MQLLFLLSSNSFLVKSIFSNLFNLKIINLDRERIMSKTDELF